MALNLWDDTRPLGSVNANTIDTEIQAVRKDVRERLVQGGHKMTDVARSGSNENNDGKHCVGVEDSASPADNGAFTLCWDGAGTTGKIKHYGSSYPTSAKRNVTEFYGDIGPLSPTTVIKFQGTAYAAYTNVVVSDALSAIGYLKRIIYKVPNSTGYPQRTLTKVGVIVGTRPVGGATGLQFEVRCRDASVTPTPETDPSLDPFADAQSDARAVAATVTLGPAANFSAEVTGLSYSLDPGDELLIKYLSVGTTTPAGDITIYLLIE